ncbi:hypothetical protein [Mycobacterium sp. OTB74]|uniref:hypothetical protein n=1 Tax=Mycobacterium sp. OTB74 TaxID=1853452 RepID=UPI00247356EC|nr:hypothetical protein [Mycobacterium sp. OTB74]MDH6242524.1 hypothetical protein [Mycobacterium sp. OTB74]
MRTSWQPKLANWQEDYDVAVEGIDRADPARERTIHIGEEWLDESDGYFKGTRHRTIKPGPRNIPEYCGCGRPLPIEWQWRGECEFDGPLGWRTINPAMESVLDDDPLLYRVLPWLWTFCHCNACIGLKRKKGRPFGYCGPRCEADAKNGRRKHRRHAKGAKPRNRKRAESHT